MHVLAPLDVIHEAFYMRPLFLDSFDLRSTKHHVSIQTFTLQWAKYEILTVKVPLYLRVHAPEVWHPGKRSWDWAAGKSEICEMTASLSFEFIEFHIDAKQIAETCIPSWGNLDDFEEGQTNLITQDDQLHILKTSNSKLTALHCLHAIHMIWISRSWLLSHGHQMSLE